MKIPKTPPDWGELLRSSMTSPEESSKVFEKLASPPVKDFVRKANNRYLHWDRLRHMEMPEGISAVEMWIAVALSRFSQFRTVELTIEDQNLFRFWIPPKHQEWLHRIDQDAGGTIGSRSKLVPKDKGDRFLFNSLMEEAIASSQLEGASTTRTIAKQMLRTGRKPRDRHEQMIINNYHAILEIRDHLNEKLTPEFLCEIHRIITEKTLDNPQAAGRFRIPEDGETFIEDWYTKDVMYRAPHPAHLGWRVDEVCDFANETSEPFIHPVIKAILLHFAIAYVHPFVDGNGRVARAIFYWSMLKNGYWIFEYLPISRIVLDSAGKYAKSYLYTETDSGDLGYFIHYNLRIIDMAVAEMQEYFANQQQLMQSARELIESLGLNHRQVATAFHAVQDPNSKISFRQHAGTFNISLATARNDLLGLQETGILKALKVGKATYFVPASHLRTSLGRGAFRRVSRRQLVRNQAKQRVGTVVESVPAESPKYDQLQKTFPEIASTTPTPPALPPPEN